MEDYSFYITRLKSDIDAIYKAMQMKDKQAANTLCNVAQCNLIALKQSIDDGTIIGWQQCAKNGIYSWADSGLPQFTDPKAWTFARAIVENRPVFVGDEMYDRNGDKFKVEFHHPVGGRAVLYMKPAGFCDDGVVAFADQCTWERKPLCMV